MPLFYKSKDLFKRRTHHDLPGYGQGVDTLECPVCHPDAPGKCNGYSTYWDKEPVTLGRCMNCMVQFMITYQGVPHVYVPVLWRDVVERRWPEGIRWEVGSRVRIRGRVRLQESDQPDVSIRVLLGTRTIIGPLIGERRATMKRVRKLLRERGMSIRDGEKIMGETAIEIRFSIE